MTILTLNPVQTHENRKDTTEIMRTARIEKIGPHGELTLRTADGSVVSSQRAISCLVQPRTGDEVLYWQTAEDTFVLSILARQGVASTSLSLPNNAPLCIQSSHLTLSGTEKVHIQSQQEIALSCLSQISINAKNLFTTVVDSVVQLASHQINKADHIALCAKQLLRSHGRQQLISADTDVKIDGERINMG